MKVAAAALLVGWGDPLALLALDDDDLLIASVVVDEAWRLRGDRERQQLKWAAENTGRAVANSVAKMLR